MKKICILSVSNIKHMTLITMYTEKLKKDNIPYDIIYMDKYGECEEFDAKTIYRFENKIVSTDPFLIKFTKYMRFVKYAKSILNRSQYDFIIVWNEVTSLLFTGYLSTKYKKRYCLNIRDYLYQDYPIIRNIFKRVIRNATFSTISSDKYKLFLPKSDYIHIHSLNTNLLSKLTPRKSLRSKNSEIRIAFVGKVRFFEINKKILQVFKNDERFKLSYYGTNSEVLEEYCIENNIKNVAFHSSFPVKETMRFINETDIVNNLYGNHNKKLDYALSIKLYYAIYNRLPILVNFKTYMQEVCENYKIGYVVDVIKEDLPDRIYTWYRSIDFEELDKNCERAVRDIELSNIKFEKVYKKYILTNNKLKECREA